MPAIVMHPRGPAAQYSSYVVPGPSHSVNLTKAAPQFNAETFRWLWRPLTLARSADCQPKH